MQLPFEIIEHIAFYCPINTAKILYKNNYALDCTCIFGMDIHEAFAEDISSKNIMVIFQRQMHHHYNRGLEHTFVEYIVHYNRIDVLEASIQYFRAYNVIFLYEEIFKHGTLDMIIAAKNFFADTWATYFENSKIALFVCKRPETCVYIIDILYWLLEQGYEFFPEDFMDAVFISNLKVIEWYVDNIILPNEDYTSALFLFRCSKSYNSREVCRFLKISFNWTQIQIRNLNGIRTMLFR